MKTENDAIDMPDVIYAYQSPKGYGTGTWIDFDDSCHKYDDIAVKYVKADLSHHMPEERKVSDDFNSLVSDLKCIHRLADENSPLFYMSKNCLERCETIRSLTTGDGWMPIESAPKDGTRILVMQPEYLHNYVSITRWLNGFISVPDHWESLNNQYDKPRYWQPLPPKDKPCGD